MLMQAEENKIEQSSRLKLAGRIFCPFFSPHLWIGFTKDSFSTPYHRVSTSTDALSSEREGLLSHQLTESWKEVVFDWIEMLEVCPTLFVSHMAFALPLGGKLTAGGIFTVVTQLARILTQIQAHFSVPRVPAFNIRQVKMEIGLLISM